MATDRPTAEAVAVVDRNAHRSERRGEKDDERSGGE